MVSRFSGDGHLIARTRIDTAPETKEAKVSFLQDVAVDDSNNLYASAVWRTQPRAFASGVFVFDPSGNYSNTISFNPPVELRHASVDASENIYALAIDADYVRQQTGLCLLIHKFSPDGKRQTAFSVCPTGARPDFRKLTADVDRGRLWIGEGQIWHLLPQSRMLRVFDTTGKQLREIVFNLPTLTAADSIARVVPLSPEAYAVEWQHSEYRGDSRNSNRFWSIHDPSGAPDTVATTMPMFTTFLSNGANGKVLALSAPRTAGPPQGIDLVTGAIDLQ